MLLRKSIVAAYMRSSEYMGCDKRADVKGNPQVERRELFRNRNTPADMSAVKTGNV